MAEVASRLARSGPMIGGSLRGPVVGRSRRAVSRHDAGDRRSWIADIRASARVPCTRRRTSSPSRDRRRSARLPGRGRL